MSLATFAIPKEYGYVVGVAVSSFFVNTWLGIRIGFFRRAAKVPYPKNQADSGDVAAAATPEAKQALYLFNCAQRGHLNYLENLPTTLGAMLISGLANPVTAAGLGSAWLVSRIVYAVGYTSQAKTDGSGRVAGFAVSLLAQQVLYLMAGYSAYKMIMS